MDILFESYTDKGFVAETNQDAVICRRGVKSSVFCVADGMGGHKDGSLASGAIYDAVVDWHKELEEETLDYTFAELADEFEAVISEVNLRIYEEYNQGEICGSTLVALFVCDDHFALFSVGDSRAYRKRGFSVQQLTRDDVWQNKPDVARDYSESEMREHPDYGKLTKSVGTSRRLSLSRITGELSVGDAFLLCSDGVYKYIGDDKLKSVFTTSMLIGGKKGIRKTVDLIRKKVLKSGAKDNFSYVVVKIVENGEKK